MAAVPAVHNADGGADTLLNQFTLLPHEKEDDGADNSSERRRPSCVLRCRASAGRRGRWTVGGWDGGTDGGGDEDAAQEHPDVDLLAGLAVLRTAADEEAVGGSVDVDGVFAGTVDPDGVGGVAALEVGQRHLHHVVLPQCGTRTLHPMLNYREPSH